MKMRRSDREVKTFDGIMDIVKNCKVCRVAVQDEEGLYIVPMNFGWELKEDNTLIFYFHCAREGRTLRAIAANPAVGFEMDRGHKLEEADFACGYAYAFECVCGSGVAEVVDDVDEKCRALSALMQHQAGKSFAFGKGEADMVTVIRLTVNAISGKIHL